MNGNENIKVFDSNLEKPELDSKKNEEEITILNINDYYDSKNLKIDINKKTINEYKDENNKKKKIDSNTKEKANIEYEKIIENSPGDLFKEITNETIEKWKKILYKKVPNLITEDCNILNASDTLVDSFAEVSKNFIPYCAAKSLPCSTVTFLSLSISHLFPTNILYTFFDAFFSISINHEFKFWNDSKSVMS